MPVSDVWFSDGFAQYDRKSNGIRRRYGRSEWWLHAHLKQLRRSGTVDACLIVSRANNPCKRCLRELKQMRRAMRQFLPPSERPHPNTAPMPASWNIADDDDPLPGSHLVTPRHGYHHHGIYLGEGTVIHYAGLCRSLHRGPVEEVSIAHFAAGHEIWIKPNPYPKYRCQETVQRARSRLGENRYHLLTNNCEHFCSWCVYGESCSEQVEDCLAYPREALFVMISFVHRLRRFTQII